MELILISFVAIIAIIACIILIIKLSNNKSDKNRNPKVLEFQRLIQLQQQQMLQMQQDFDRRAAELSRRSEELSRAASLELKNLSNETLRNQQEYLQKVNAEQLGVLLNPLKSRIEDFSRAATEAYVNENATRKSLSDQITELMRLNASIGKEARDLTMALRKDNKVQGDWGEYILEQVLQQSGLKEGLHYIAQETTDDAGDTLRDENGRRRRPDVILLLPGNKKIIIDSKVSLTAYMDYTAAESDEVRKQAAAKLHQSVKRHIDELSGKGYHKIVKGAAEQVLMFFPVEGAYFAVVNEDNSLPLYAMGKKVVIVTPTHLISVVQLIEQLWRVEKQNNNAAEIARLGGLIYDKMLTFTKDLENIKKGLKSADEAYEKCLKDITTGSQSVLARTQKMKVLGAKTDKLFPNTITSELDLNSYKIPDKD